MLKQDFFQKRRMDLNFPLQRQDFAKIIHNCQTRKSVCLDLTGMLLTDYELHELMLELEKNTFINILILNENYISNYGASCIANMLMKNETITKIHMENTCNKISEKSLEMFLKIVQYNCSVIQFDFNVSSTCIHYIKEELKKNKKIQDYIILSKCTTHEEFIKWMKKAKIEKTIRQKIETRRFDKKIQEFIEISNYTMLLLVNLPQTKKKKLQLKLSSYEMNQLFFYNSNDTFEDICQKINILQLILQSMNESNTEIPLPKKYGPKKVRFNPCPEILNKK